MTKSDADYRQWLRGEIAITETVGLHVHKDNLTNLLDDADRCEQLEACAKELAEALDDTVKCIDPFVWGEQTEAENALKRYRKLMNA